MLTFILLMVTLVLLIRWSISKTYNEAFGKDEDDDDET